MKELDIYYPALFHLRQNNVSVFAFDKLRLTGSKIVKEKILRKSKTPINNMALIPAPSSSPSELVEDGL